jgi:hypothetical protein
MKMTRPTSAKIIHHAEGLGAPTAETVRRRAQELAIINGHQEFSEEDWREAKRELHGGHEQFSENGDVEMSAMISEHDMVVGSVGHHTENRRTDDSDHMGEELIAEGMDEAVHEQMLAARREEPVEDEE